MTEFLCLLFRCCWSAFVILCVCLITMHISSHIKQSANLTFVYIYIFYTNTTVLYTRRTPTHPSITIHTHTHTHSFVHASIFFCMTSSGSFCFMHVSTFPVFLFFSFPFLYFDAFQFIFPHASAFPSSLLLLLLPFSLGPDFFPCAIIPYSSKCYFAAQGVTRMFP